MQMDHGEAIPEAVQGIQAGEKGKRRKPIEGAFVGKFTMGTSEQCLWKDWGTQEKQAWHHSPSSRLGCSINTLTPISPGC